MEQVSVLVMYSLMLCLSTHSFDKVSEYKYYFQRSNVVLNLNSLTGCLSALIGASSDSWNALPNSAMSASTSQMNHPPHSGRLFTNKWWMPAVHDKSQYLMVDLTSLSVVRKAGVRGSDDSTTAGARVISYFLYYSMDGHIWFPVLEKENVRQFVGNINNSEVISKSSFPPFLARYVKLCPQSWQNEIALRVELYGCKAKAIIISTGMDIPIGMERKSIPDNAISATSAESTTFRPSSARLNLDIAGGGWCAKKSLHDVPQYLQVDLERIWALIAVATQGVVGIQSWVSQYYLSTSLDHKNWVFVHDFTGKKLLKGFSLLPENVVMHHLPTFTWMNAVRIHPHIWHQGICLRVEFYGMDSSESFSVPGGEEWCGANAEFRGPKSSPFIAKCFCSAGYEGDGFHCEDVDECSIGDNVCGFSDRRCVNTIGSFICECGKGTTGKGGYCNDIDECIHPRDVCPYMTDCINTVGSFFCDCKVPGYLADGKQCLDINECANGNHTCPENSVCVNALGSFACFCTTGYTSWESLDGKQQCSDIDECAVNPNVCDGIGLCENTEGSYHCICNEGFTARGSQCEDLDECASNPAICEPYATCVNLPGSYACQCKIGYHLTESLCQDVNECQQNLAECHHLADCYNTDGSYLCVCQKGFYGDGFYCSQNEQCSKEDEECNEALKRDQEKTGVKAAALKKSDGQ